MWSKVASTARWSEMHNLSGVVNERCVDLINLAWASVGRLPLYCDLSQSASRKPWCQSVRSIVSASVIYSFEADRILILEEHYRLLGIDMELPPLTPGDHRNLTGEAMAAPSVGLGILLAVAQLPDVWERQEACHSLTHSKRRKTEKQGPGSAHDFAQFCRNTLHTACHRCLSSAQECASSRPVILQTQ